jgi:hypothetical protein
MGHLRAIAVLGEGQFVWFPIFLKKGKRGMRQYSGKAGCQRLYRRLARERYMELAQSAGETPGRGR